MHLAFWYDTKSILVCGPNALKSGVGNAIAGLQRLVIQGQVQAISLDSETFGRSTLLLN
jgi:hypothetical protein